MDCTPEPRVVTALPTKRKGSARQMKMLLRVFACLLFMAASTLFAGRFADTSPASVSLCSLVKNPTIYAGKIVAVNGEIGWGWVGGNKPASEFGITPPFASTECISELTVVLPDAVQPKPFDVERDEHLERLEEGLHKGMRIEGTFEGRFEQTEKSYGRRHKLKMRLVLKRVSNIFAMPVFRPK
jgi:hypothetical protein